MGGVVRRRIQLAALAAFSVVASGAVDGQAQARQSAKLPPVPACFSQGTGYGSCSGIAIPAGAAVTRMTAENRKEEFYLLGPAPLQSTKAAACGDAGCVYHHLNWVLGVGAAAVRGCGVNQSVCDVKVAPGSGWVPVYVRQDNDTAILYAIYNTGKKGQAVIDGYVKDKQGNGVAGAAIDAYGEGKSHGQSGLAVSGDGGFYNMEVPAGTYKLIPSGGLAGKKKPTYKPDSAEVTVKADGHAKANFQVQGGLDVQLTLSKTSATADGYTVVTGLISTTKYGKPAPNVAVELWPKPSDTPTKAVSSGPFATVCASNSGSRIWPAGTLTAPNGEDVKIQTDANGQYHFSLTVGTVPGAFSITAWALDASGTPISEDVTDVSDEATLTLTPPGRLTTAQFLTELGFLKGDAASAPFSATTNDAADIVQTLSHMSDATGKLGGLAYSLVYATAGGTAVLIYGDANPPLVSETGRVIAGKDTLVMEPSEWSGSLAKVGKAVVGAPTALNDALKQGALQNLPSFGQWISGAAVSNWTLVKNQAAVTTSSFEYQGWPYPAARPGACN